MKRHLPLIAILAFSCLLALGGTALLFFTTRYPLDAMERLMLSLRQGVIGSVTLAVLLLAGWGLQALLARIPDASRRRRLSLIIYLGSFVLCVALPAIGIGGVWLLFSEQDGWQELPAAPAPAVQVASIGTDVVIVRAEDGGYYYCWLAEPDKCWQTVEKPGNPLLPDYEGEVQPIDTPPAVTPPEGVMDIAGISYNRMGVYYETHFAVMSDGSVWYLNRETNNATAAFIAGLFSILVFPLVGGTFTVLVGAGIASGARRLADRIPAGT